MTEGVNPGDLHVAAMWYIKASGKRHAKETIRAAFANDAAVYGVRFGQIAFEIVWPGDERLPKAPPVTGIRCMIGTARVERVGLAKQPVTEDPDGEVIDVQKVNGTHYPIRGFFGDLSERSKMRMMEAGRQAYAELNPGKPAPSPEKLIAWAEAVGPNTWDKIMRRYVDEGRVS